MKPISFLFFVCIASSLWGQNLDFVYLSSDDFSNQKPTLTVMKEKGEKIKYIFPKGLGHIKVIKKDTIGYSKLNPFVVKNEKGLIVYKFKSKSIYGYCKNGQCFRYYEDPKSWKIHDGYHTIEDTSNLYIYSRRMSNGRYGSTVRYYYSLNVNDKLKHLTIENLEMDFKQNQIIFDKLKQDTLLKKNIAKRNKDGTFRVNTIISESFKSVKQ